VYLVFTFSSGNKPPLYLAVNAYTVKPCRPMHIIMLRLKCYILSISESTPAVADTADDDDEDASQFDVTVPHPEHLLLVIFG